MTPSHTPPPGGEPYRGPERRRSQRSDLTLRRLTALTDAAAAMVHATTIQQVATIAVQAGVEAVGAGGGTVAVLDAASGRLRLSSTVSYSPTLLGSFAELPLEAGLPLCHTARTGEPLLLPDRRSALARFPGVEAHHELSDGAGEALVAAAVLPLRAGGAVLGSLAVTWSVERSFDREDVALLDALAGLVAEAVARVRSAADRDKALERASLLARAGEVLVAGRDPNAVLQALARLVVPALADRAVARLQDGRLSASHPTDEIDGTDESYPSWQRPDAGRTATPTRRSSAGRLPEQRAADTPARCVVVLGVVGRSVGTLTVERCGLPYADEEVDLLAELARRAAAVLDTALALVEQRETSLALQRALLTEPPEPNHLHLVVRYLPATHAAVGGDWYDAVLTPDGATVLVIGDVVGHDAQAAASMGQLRGLLRALAYTGGASPAVLLTAVEDAARGLAVDAMATVLVGRLERHPDRPGGRRLLRWSNAGHPPAVLAHADGTAELLESEPDVMLGVQGGLVRTDQLRELADGDTLLLYTDGLIERRDAPLDDGLARLVECVGELAGEHPDVLCDSVLDRMLPRGVEDDVALLAVRLHPEDRPRPASAGPNVIPTPEGAG